MQWSLDYIFEHQRVTKINVAMLEQYKAKEEQFLDLTPKDFFEQEYFELFFNHQKYMQWPTNSPFVQMKSGQKIHSLTIVAVYTASAVQK